MRLIIITLPTNLVTNSLLFLCFIFQTPKTRTNFQEVVGLVTKNFFCLWRVRFNFKTLLNSIDFYEVIFLHVIPVCIVFPRSDSKKVQGHLVVLDQIYPKRTFPV